MNKLLIVLLAVCLVSVHAFVKRDAPAEKPFDLQGVQDKLAEFGKHLETTFDAENLKKFFDSEKLKKDFNDFIDGANKAFKDDKAA